MLLLPTAIADGPVSTFAWYQTSNAGANVTTNAGDITLTTTKQDVTLSDVSVVITVTVTSNVNQNTLALARYKSDQSTYKNLASGYIDQGGAFVEVLGGSVASTFGGTIANLYGTLTVTVAVDFNDGKWSGSTPGSRTFTESGNTFTEAYIIQQLQSATVDVTITCNNDYGRLFAADGNAPSGDYFYAGESTSTYNGGWEILDSVSLSGLAYANDAVSESVTKALGTVNYYVYGGATNYSHDSAQAVTFTASVAKHTA